MNLNCDLIELFYEPNTEVKSLVNSLTVQDWLKNQHRQQTFEVHKETQSVVYIWSWDNYEDLDIHIHQDENRLSQLVYGYANRIKSHFNQNSIITKLMLAKIPAGGIISEHVDMGNLEHIRRCHYVIKTNNECVFNINGTPYLFQEGAAVEINNQALHSVMNGGTTDRVHLLCDILER